MSSLRLTKATESKLKKRLASRQGLSIQDATDIISSCLEISSEEAMESSMKRAARKLLRSLGAMSVIASSHGERVYREVHKMSKQEIDSLAYSVKRGINSAEEKRMKLLERSSELRAMEEKKSQRFLFKAQEMNEQAKEEASKRDGTIAM